MSKKRKQCDAIVQAGDCNGISCDATCHIQKQCRGEGYEMAVKIASEWLSKHPKKKGDPMISKREAAEKNVKAEGFGVYCAGKESACPLLGYGCRGSIEGALKEDCFWFSKNWLKSNPEEPINEYHAFRTELFALSENPQFSDVFRNLAADLYEKMTAEVYKVPSPDLYDIRVIEEPTHIERWSRVWRNNHGIWESMMSLKEYDCDQPYQMSDTGYVSEHWFEGKKSAIIPPEKE